jgi:hypothetical protein
MPNSSRALLWKRVLEAIEMAKGRDGADYYKGRHRNGDHMDDPSEDGLFMLLGDFHAGTAFIITQADGSATWRASVAQGCRKAAARRFSCRRRQWQEGAGTFS